MKQVVIAFVNPLVRKNLSPFYKNFIFTNESMDDGTNCAILNGDTLKCRLLTPIFWNYCKNLETLNLVVIKTRSGEFTTGKILYKHGSEKITLHKFNSDWQNPEFDLSDILEIYIVDHYIREA